MNSKGFIFLGVFVILLSAIGKASNRIKYNSKRVGNNAYLNKFPESEYNLFSRFIQEIELKGYTVQVTDTLRTFEEQSYLYKKDKNNAKPGYSPHEKGTAIDIVMYKNGKFFGKGKQYLQDWINSGVPNIAKKYGLGWGGIDFGNYIDTVHFYKK